MMKKIALLIICCTFVFSCKDQVDASWHMEEVDAPRAFGQLHERSMAISSNGTVHIAYGGDHLYHAWYDGNMWNYETVDPSPRTGTITSIAIDTSGKVHIIYRGGDFLKYASNVSGVWVIEEVDDCNSDDVSFALDANDKVHVCFNGIAGSTLKYATNASGSWVIETADSMGGWYNTSLALDSSDKVHISYSQYGLLMYATNASGAWTT
jgi:hypothetical protein